MPLQMRALCTFSPKQPEGNRFEETENFPHVSLVKNAFLNTEWLHGVTPRFFHVFGAEQSFEKFAINWRWIYNEQLWLVLKKSKTLLLALFNDSVSM